jgi:hypothetical protein
MLAILMAALHASFSPPTPKTRANKPMQRTGFTDG